MKIQRIREIAKGIGLNAGNMSKTELIRAIQKAEVYSDCFATKSVDRCNQITCLWR
jgi:hypothetical protein